MGHGLEESDQRSRESVFVLHLLRISQVQDIFLKGGNLGVPAPLLSWEHIRSLCKAAPRLCCTQHALGH